MTTPRWTVPKIYKVQYRPLADFRYLWEAPHFQESNNPIIREKVTRRLGWETTLPGMTNRATGHAREMLMVYHSVLKDGVINPLPCIEQDDLLYPVKGNQRLCALRAIAKLIEYKQGRLTPLTMPEKQWVDKEPDPSHTNTTGSFDLDAIPCRIAPHDEHPGDWTHDHPVARNHIGDEVRV